MAIKYKFVDIEQRLKDAIDAKAGTFVGEATVTLVEGFISLSVQPELGGDVGLMIGGPAIPLVAVVGNTTGKVYYFALKALLPELDI